MCRAAQRRHYAACVFWNATVLTRGARLAAPSLLKTTSTPALSNTDSPTKVSDIVSLRLCDTLITLPSQHALISKNKKTKNNYNSLFWSATQRKERELDFCHSRFQRSQASVLRRFVAVANARSERRRSLHLHSQSPPEITDIPLAQWDRTKPNRVSRARNARPSWLSTSIYAERAGARSAAQTLVVRSQHFVSQTHRRASVRGGTSLNALFSGGGSGALVTVGHPSYASAAQRPRNQTHLLCQVVAARPLSAYRCVLRVLLRAFLVH